MGVYWKFYAKSLDFIMCSRQKIFVIGKLPPGIINSLTTNWLASLAHQYETVRALHEYGEMTLRRAEFTTVLIGEGVAAEDRHYI